MTHAFVMAVWQRESVTKFCIEQMHKRIQQVTTGGHFVIVGSQGKHSEALAKMVGAFYLEHDNLPLGKKLNAGFQLARNFEVDSVTWLQSDDLCDTEALQALLLSMHDFQYAGFLNAYMFNTTTREMKHWPGYSGPRQGETLGVFRTFRCDLLDDCGWQPFGESNKINQDGQMTKRLQSYRPLEAKLQDKFVVLLKGQDATNRYDWCHGEVLSAEDQEYVWHRCGIIAEDVPVN